MKTLLFAAIALALTGCTTVSINTSASNGPSNAAASVEGSAWAEVAAESSVVGNAAHSSAGRSHPVAGQGVGAAQTLGLAAIGAGLGAGGGAPGMLLGAGAGTVLGSVLADGEDVTSGTAVR